MDSSLLVDIHPETRAAICQELWGHSKVQAELGLTMDPYWLYYSRSCADALRDRGRHCAMRTHRDVVEVAQQLKAGVSRHEIKEALRGKATATHANEDDLLENSINLAVSLLSMIDCGSLVHGFSGKTEISWKDGSLRQYLDHYFEEKPVLAHNGVRLQKNFTARNLCRIAGMKIVWADNLVDHLRLTEDDSKVHIFHHASFLECERQSPESLLPAGVAHETLQTLALLFPSGDSTTKKWFFKLSGAADLDGHVISCGRLRTDHRQVEKFVFWRDRLVTLKQVFDETQPKTISQWWHDRRNGVQWYTFWVAVVVLMLTIVFGFIQSVEGALQVYTAFKSLSSGP